MILSITVLETTLPTLDVAIRLLVATLLGGVIGLERELKDHQAGLRTNMLTSLAGATFTIAAFEIYQHTIRVEATAGADPIRVIEAVTAGVAFLAAGSIIRSGREVHGLTTGAGMWLAGGIGMVCGLGYFVLAALASGIAVAILAGVGFIERRFIEGEPRRTGDDAPQSKS